MVDNKDEWQNHLGDGDIENCPRLLSELSAWLPSVVLGLGWVRFDEGAHLCCCTSAFLDSGGPQCTLKNGGISAPKAVP